MKSAWRRETEGSFKWITGTRHGV